MYVLGFLKTWYWSIDSKERNIIFDFLILNTFVTKEVHEHFRMWNQPKQKSKHLCHCPGITAVTLGWYHATFLYAYYILTCILFTKMFSYYL